MKYGSFNSLFQCLSILALIMGFIIIENPEEFLDGVELKTEIKLEKQTELEAAKMNK